MKAIWSLYLSLISCLTSSMTLKAETKWLNGWRMNMNEIERFTAAQALMKRFF